MNSTILLWMLVLSAALLAARQPGRFQEGFRLACQHAWLILPRVPIAILGAGFMASMLPEQVTGDWLGADSGFTGILIASVVGAFIPSGPIIAFPIVIALERAGAGMPQLIAFLTAWEVYAIHRILIWELPLLTGGFVVRRLISTALVPPLAGILAALIIQTGLQFPDWFSFELVVDEAPDPNLPDLPE